MLNYLFMIVFFLNSQVKLTSTLKVEGLVYQKMNVTLDLQDLKFGNDAYLTCKTSVPYITFQSEDSESHKTLGEVIKQGQQSHQFQIESNLIGIFGINCEIEENGFYLDKSINIEVVVGRIKVDENLLVNVGMSVGLGLALLIMGMEIETEQVLEVVKKPIGPIVGFCCQFIVMPLTAYGLGYLLLDTNYERLGLLLLGCCPGGVGSNFWTAMLGGDINLSVTMTFFSSVAAFAMTSLWVWLLGSTLISETDDLPIPYSQLAIALVSFAVPVVLGVTAKKFKPKLCEKIKSKIGRPLWLTFVLALVVGGVVMNLFFFYLVSWGHLLSGALLGLCGYTIGGSAAWLARMTKPQIIAVAIETAIQNGGIAVVVLNLTFPSPYSDMALLPILAFFFCSAGPFLFLLFLIKNVVTKIKSRLKPGKEEFGNVSFHAVELKY